MERGLNLAWEYKTTLINELTQGMEKAKQLHFHLCSTSGSEAQDLLLQRILASYEKALSILKRKESSLLGQTQVHTQAPGGLELSVSVDRSPRSDDSDKNLRDHQQYNASKKRKKLPTWREQVRVNSENGLDGPGDDGYSWRKYGQKDILGAKYPRSYYRCTYRLVQNCWSTKQVQRSEDDPNLFEITYKGTHTCNQSSNPVRPKPESHELKHNSHLHRQHNQALLDFKANLRVSTDNLDDNKNNETPNPPQFSFPSTYSESHELPVDSFGSDNRLGSYCPPFLSPSTSGTSYFSPVNYHVQNFGGHNQHSGSDIAEIVSTHASTTNSPMGGVGFPSDLDLDPNFVPFNFSGFFT